MNYTKFSPNKRYHRFDKLIGSGSMKSVYEGYDLNEGKLVAWNIVEIDKLPISFQPKIIQEVEILNKIKDKNQHIMNINNSWIDKDKRIMHFITNFASGNNLGKFIKNVKFIKIKVIKKWCKQILSGLDFLHKNNIVHRDIKTSNIFINSNSGNLFIGDFGLSKISEDSFKTMLGTPEYMAPEVYDEKYDHRIDIYAFGMCLLEMLSNEIPYSECSMPAQIWKKITDGILPDCLKKVSNKFGKELILICINHNPDERPDINKIYGHDFFINDSMDNQIVNENELFENKSEELISMFRDKEEV